MEEIKKKNSNKKPTSLALKQEQRPRVEQLAHSAPSLPHIKSHDTSKGVYHFLLTTELGQLPNHAFTREVSTC